MQAWDEVQVLFDYSAFDSYTPTVDVLNSTIPYEQGTDGITRVFIENSETFIKQISRYLYKYSQTEMKCCWKQRNVDVQR